MPKHHKDHLPVLEPDDLLTPDVGEWGYKKYLRVWSYDELVSTAMRDKYRTVYLDLFAGAGRATLRDSKRIVPSSALLALDLPHPFHRYIFCEADPRRMEALRARVEAVAPHADIHFVPGDVNETVNEVRALIPPGALSFAFVDPYSINIRLETLRRLSAGNRMDFLILLAVQMDANRNRAVYAAEESRRLEDFLGNPAWRSDWEKAQRQNTDFRTFLLDQYVRGMMRIGYVESTRAEMYEMRTEMRGISIYYLAFFSKHQLGKKFWKEVLKYNDPQANLYEALGL